MIKGLHLSSNVKSICLKENQCLRFWMGCQMRRYFEYFNNFNMIFLPKLRKKKLT